MEQLCICASFLLPGGGTELLCAFPQLSLADGDSPALELHFKEPPSTLKLGELGHSEKLTELWGKHNHSSSPHCTEESQPQGLS